MVVPQNGWFTRDNPFKMDDLGVLLFQETSMSFFQTKMAEKYRIFRPRSKRPNLQQHM